MAEVWRSIKGYEGFYEVSNRGRVRSLDRVVQRMHPRWGKLCNYNLKGKLLSPAPGHVGHLYVQLSLNGTVQTTTVHRLVAQAFIPNPDNLPFVMHKDDNPSNNHRKNLGWGTPQDNSSDMVQKGRSKVGSCNHSAKLTEKNVREIKALLGQGVSGKAIAKLYGMNPATISEIRRGVSWKHV